MHALRAALALLALAVPARASGDAYGDKGIYPVYETAGQWFIFDKKPAKGKDSPLALGQRFLVVGSEGSGLFGVARSSAAYGGACRKHQPLRLRTALLKGPRSQVGRPIIGIHVPDSFTLKGSRALYVALKNQVGEDAYKRLGDALRESGVEDAKSGSFHFGLEDNQGYAFLQNPRPEAVQFKIDFGSSLRMRGLAEPFVLVEESSIGGSFRRCMRLADGAKLVGDCAEMPRALMAETDLLQFVSYDPSGAGNPFLLAFTKTTPLWGDERWGFVVRAEGPRLFLMDTLDIKCREGF